MLDDLWSEAIAQGDVAATEIGRRMNTLMEQLAEDSKRVSHLIGNSKDALNHAWPYISEKWILSNEQRKALDAYFEKHGGLGTAGFALSAGLRDSLAEESASLSAKIAELEIQGHTTIDISRLGKVMIAVVGICVFAVPAIAAGAVIGGVMTVGLAVVTAGMAEAGIVGSIAGSLILAS